MFRDLDSYHFLSHYQFCKLMCSFLFETIMLELCSGRRLENSVKEYFQKLKI